MLRRRCPGPRGRRVSWVHRPEAIGSGVEELGQRVLVVAFDGWNDAGEAATAAVSHVRESGAYRDVFAVDPELYFDYQYTRPQVRLEADGSRRLVWPDATLARPLHPEDGPRLWLLSGYEPARAWQGFVAEIIDAALREDITGIVALGSMMSDVPHTRPISIFAGSENEALRTALGLEKPTYEGPAGILTALSAAAETAGIPCAALWASVPHYVAGHTPSPKATLALVERLSGLTGAAIPLGTLPAESLAWEATIDAAASDDEEMTEYIRQLEQTRDTWDSPEASGDAIAQEFERYLRRGGGDGTKGSGGSLGSGGPGGSGGPSTPRGDDPRRQ